MALKMIAFDGANAQSLSFSRSSVVNLRLVPFRTVSFGFRTVKTPRRLRFCTSSAKRNPKRLKYSAPSITKALLESFLQIVQLLHERAPCHGMNTSWQTGGPASAVRVTL